MQTNPRDLDTMDGPRQRESNGGLLPSNLTDEGISRFDPSMLIHHAIALASQYEALRADHKTLEAAETLKRALPIADFIYRHRYRKAEPNKVMFPQLYMQEGATEEGALGLVVDPDKDYSTTGYGYFLLKKVDQRRGIQALQDSKHFQNDPNFNLEQVLANLPAGNNESYLWKSMIVGPNLSEMFRTLDRDFSSRLPEDQQLTEQIESELKDIARKRLWYWQTNALPLAHTTPNPDEVVREYKRRYTNVLQGFSKYTDVKFSQEEMNNFRKALDGLDWRFMDERKVVRNAASTLRNMVMSTGRIHMDFTRIKNLVPGNGGTRYALESRLFFVDPPAKYSHPLEDAWEIDQSMEGVSGPNRPAVRYLVDQYHGRKIDFSKEEIELMAVYRAFRKAYLIITKFGPRAIELAEMGAIDQQKLQDTLKSYSEYVSHLIGLGQRSTDKLGRSGLAKPELMATFVSTFKKISTYTSIDYQKAAASAPNHTG